VGSYYLELYLSKSNPLTEEELEALKESLETFKAEAPGAAFWLDGPRLVVTNEIDECISPEVLVGPPGATYPLNGEIPNLIYAGKMYGVLTLSVEDCNRTYLCPRGPELHYEDGANFLPLHLESYLKHPEEALGELLNRAGRARKFMERLETDTACWPKKVLAEVLTEEEIARGEVKCQGGRDG